MKCVGIDVGSTCIRVAEVDYQNRSYSLTSYREFPLKLNPGNDLALETIEILRTVTEAYTSAERFILSIGTEKITFRFRSFPFKERQKIYKSLPFELEDETPFTMDDAIFEAKILRYFGQGADTIALACPKEAIEAKLEFAKDIGIQAHTLSTDGAAIANLIDRWWEPPPAAENSLQPLQREIEEEHEDEDDEPAPEDEARTTTQPLKVVVHIDHKKTILVAFDDMGTVAINTIMWGHHYAVSKITELYEIPYQEAYKQFLQKSFILITRAGADIEQVRFSEAISSTYKQLVLPLRRTLLSWQSEFGSEISEILLCGEGSSVENLGPFLTTLMEIPTNRFQYVDRLQKTQIELTQEQIYSAPVSIGLAIEGHRRPRNPAVNFLKDEYAVKSEVLAQLWSRWGRSIQFAAALLVLFTVYGLIKSLIAEDLAEKSAKNLVTQGKVVTGRGANAAKIRRYIKDEEKIAKVQRKLVTFAGMNSGLDILNSVTQSFPRRGSFNVEIKKFDLRYNQLKIEGVVDSQEDLATVDQSLKKIAKGKLNQQKPTIQSDRVAFAYSLIVDREVRKK